MDSKFFGVILSNLVSGKLIMRQPCRPQSLRRSPDGRAIPGTLAKRDELRAVATEVEKYGGFM